MSPPTNRAPAESEDELEEERLEERLVVRFEEDRLDVRTFRCPTTVLVRFTVRVPELD